MRKAGSFILASLLVAACGVGDDTMGGDDEPLPIDPNPNRLTCSASFVLTGTWTAGTPARPTDPETMMPVGGCWPVGTWTFTARVETAAEAAARGDDVIDITGDQKGERCGDVPGTAAPTVNSSYSFRVDRVDDGEGFVESYTYLGDMTNYWKTKVSEGGAGDCEGAAEFISSDKKMHWIMKPNQTGTTLTGFGEFTHYMDPQPY